MRKIVKCANFAHDFVFLGDFWVYESITAQFAREGTMKLATLTAVVGLISTPVLAQETLKFAHVYEIGRASCREGGRTRGCAASRAEAYLI